MTSTWPDRRDTAATPAWAQEPAAQRTKNGNGHEEGPRDVESMKKEITQVQSDTTQSLDRAIAVAQAATGVGGHVAEELVEQREKVHRFLLRGIRRFYCRFFFISECAPFSLRTLL